MSEVETTLVVPQTSAPIEGLQSQEPQIEAEPKAEPPKKTDDFLAPKFAALTRKERQVREMERSIKQKEAEIAQKLAEFEEKSKSAQAQESALLAEMRKNPLRFMEKHGLTFDQLTEMQLNAQNPTPEMLMEQMRAELKAEMEEKYGKLTESLAEKEKREAQERYDAAVNGYKSEIQEFVTKNAETYELIVANGATDLMFETAEAFYKQTGQVPDLERVAQAVEKHLEDEANKILSLKKFQKLQQPQKTEAKPNQTAPTLSNTLAAEVPKSSNKLLSDEQSKAEAAKLLRWIE